MTAHSLRPSPPSAAQMQFLHCLQRLGSSYEHARYRQRAALLNWLSKTVDPREAAQEFRWIFGKLHVLHQLWISKFSILNNSTQQSHPSEVNGRCRVRKSPKLGYINPFHTPPPQQHIYSTYILILSFRLSLGLPRGLIPLGFRTENFESITDISLPISFP
jgi:hypothetical protein